MVKWCSDRADWRWCTLPQILSGGRYLVLLAVIATFLAAAATFIWGAVRMLRNVAELLAGVAAPAHEETAVQGVQMIAVLDSFLLAVVLYIFSVALYELFIGPLKVPEWLVIKNLDGLKVKLTSVIIMVMAVTFVEHLVLWERPQETLMFAGAVALVLLALIFFMRHVSSKEEAAEE